MEDWRLTQELSPALANISLIIYAKDFWKLAEYQEATLKYHTTHDLLFLF